MIRPSKKLVVLGIAIGFIFGIASVFTQKEVKPEVPQEPELVFIQEEQSVSEPKNSEVIAESAVQNPLGAVSKDCGNTQALALQGPILQDISSAAKKDIPSIKAEGLSNFNSCGTYTIAPIKVEIKSLRNIGEGVEIYARAWKNNVPLGFGDGSVEIEKFIIMNPPIMVPDGTQSLKMVEGREVLRDNFKEDPVAAIHQVLADIVKISSKNTGKSPIVLGKVGHSTLTTYPAAGVGGTSVDGGVFRTGVDETIAVIRAGAGTAHDDTSSEISFVRLQASTTSNQFQGDVRHALTLPGIGVIGAGDVTAATFSIWVTDKTSYDGLSGSASANSAGVLVAATPASTNDLVNADYSQLGATDFGRTSAQASLTTGAYNDITCNASCQTTIETAATGSGIVGFGLRIGWDFDNTITGLTHVNSALQGWLGYDADLAGTTSDPRLVVTYTGVVTGERRVILIQ